MSHLLNREDFLHRLESVQPGLSPRTIVEQSNCFVFRNGLVLTFNEEVACRMKSGLDKEFRGAVPSDKFLELVRRLPDEEITLTVEEAGGSSQILVTGKKRRAGVRFEKEIVLPIDVDKPQGWTKLHPDFCEAVNIVQQCAGTDESKFRAVCIHIHPKWVEASDDVQLCRWNLKTGFDKALLVRRNSIKHITNLGMIEFAETASWVHFRNNSGLTLSCRRYLEEYPDLSKVLEVSGSSVIFPKALSEEMGRAEIFSVENAESNHVTVKLEPRRLFIKGDGLSGWYERWFEKFRYKGQACEFLIAPQLLADLVNRHNEFIINDRRLAVNGGPYKFVTCLSMPQVSTKEGGEE